MRRSGSLMAIKVKSVTMPKVMNIEYVLFATATRCWKSLKMLEKCSNSTLEKV